MYLDPKHRWLRHRRPVLEMVAVVSFSFIILHYMREGALEPTRFLFFEMVNAAALNH